MKEQADDLNMRNRLIDAEPDRQSADEDEENNGDTDVSIKPAQKKKLTIVGEDGSEEDVEIILNFEFADTKKNTSCIPNMNRMKTKRLPFMYPLLTGRMKSRS